MFIKGNLLSAQNLNDAFLSLTSTTSQNINSSLTIGGGSLTLKSSIIDDTYSSAYLHISPQGNTMIIYDGVNDQTFRVYGSSGSESISLQTFSGANYSLIDVMGVDHLEINTNSGKPTKFGGNITLLDGNGIYSASGALLHTGAGGGTWLARQGSSTASIFIGEDFNGNEQFVVESDGQSTFYNTVTMNRGANNNANLILTTSVGYEPAKLIIDNPDSTTRYTVYTARDNQSFTIENTGIQSGGSGTGITVMYGVGTNVYVAGDLYSKNNIVWNSGNDGAGSGLDADLLDGLNSSSFVRTDAPSTINARLTLADSSTSTGLEIGKSGTSETPYIDFHSSGLSTDFDSRIIASGGNSTNGNGTLNIMAGSLLFNSQTVFHDGSDITVAKNNPWLTLNSSSSGGNGDSQGAGISIGESGYKGGAALHLTYTGDGRGHIGMGVVDATSGIPQHEAIQFFYTDNVTRFLGGVDMYGNVDMEDSGGEKHIRSVSLNTGFYFNTGDIGLYDWANSRNIWHYNQAGNQMHFGSDINMDAGSITNITDVNGRYGNIAQSNDEWLRLNVGNQHSNGVYFSTSIVRTDGQFQVGANGSAHLLEANGNYTLSGILELASGSTGGSITIRSNSTTYGSGDAHIYYAPTRVRFYPASQGGGAISTDFTLAVYDGGTYRDVYAKGKNISWGTGTPSGGADGDIFIQY